MNSLKRQFSNSDFQNDLDILLQDGIIFSNDSRVICLHTFTTEKLQAELSNILQEMAATSMGNYDLEDEGIEKHHILDGHWPKSDGESVRVIYTTEVFNSPSKAKNFVATK